jgi:glutamate racemase
MRPPIGIFDSGIGGLTVAAEIKRQLPNQPIIYFGDTAHLPYGDKSSKTIRGYIQRISKFLAELGCTTQVVACNSASSVLKENQAYFNTTGINFINVVDPVVLSLSKNHSIKNVGIIGTKRTVNSKVYSKQIKELRPDIRVTELATPLLAPMIEEGFINAKIASTIIEEYTTKLPNNLDALILGCTHYPLIKEQIQEQINRNVLVLDAPEKIAEFLLNQLGTSDKTDIQDQFYVSDYTTSFELTAKLFFGKFIHLQEVQLPNTGK